MRVLASERARRGEGRRGVSARGRRGWRRWARAPRGGRLVGLTPGLGGTQATSARGEGAPRMAGPGPADERDCGRHAPAGVSWGRASGWAGRVEFASRRWGTSGQRGVPAESRGPRKRVGALAWRWQREATGLGASRSPPVCRTCVTE